MRHDSPDFATTPGDAHHGIQRIGAIYFLMGVWLVIAPSVLRYDGSDPWWNPMVCGMLVALVGLGRASATMSAGASSIVNALLGTWLFASAFWLSVERIAAWNAAACGAAIVLVASISHVSERAARTFGAIRGRPADTAVRYR